MDNIRTNVGELYSGETGDVSRVTSTLIASASTSFELGSRCVIEMTKVIDRPGELYFPGDTITFTITIRNNGTSAATGLFFSDEIDESVEPVSGTEFTVTTTSGTITSRTSPININDITVPAGGTVTITITGRIA